MSATYLLLVGMAACVGTKPAPAKPWFEGWSVKGERIAQAEAIERYQLKRRLTSYDSDYFSPDPKATVRVVEGNLSINGNLRMDWEGWGANGLIVTGDLSVSGAIVNANMNEGPFLLVGGKTQAYAIVGGGAEFAFEGDAQVTDIVIGHYNDGVLVFKGNLVAPAVVTMDHDLDIRGELDGRWFDVYDSDDKWALFLDMRQPALARMEEDEWQGLDEVLIPMLETRRSVLRPDLPPKSDHPK